MVRKQHKWGDPRWNSTQFEECYYCGIKRVQIPGKVKVNTVILVILRNGLSRSRNVAK
jgi:hypothetical protein